MGLGDWESQGMDLRQGTSRYGPWGTGNLKVWV